MFTIKGPGQHKRPGSKGSFWPRALTICHSYGWPVRAAHYGIPFAVFKDRPIGLHGAVELDCHRCLDDSSDRRSDEAQLQLVRMARILNGCQGKVLSKFIITTLLPVGISLLYSRG